MSVNISQISPTKNVSIGESTLSVTSMSVNISQISPTKNVSIGEADILVMWEPSGGQTTQPSQCQPVIKTGISALDNVLFCVDNYGITLLVIIIAFFVLLLLLRR